MIVKAIYRYPIKSCGGEKLQQAKLDKLGIQGDRRWMLIDPNNRMVTQRQCAKMCLIQVKTSNKNQPGLVVNSPGFQALFIQQPASQNTIEVQVWQDKCQAWLADETAHQWFSNVLGRAVRLVWFPDTSQRQIDLNYAQIGEQLAFADGFPLLLTNQASLDDLNQRLAEPIEMIRFRPNIVINTGCAFEEDQHAEVMIGEHCFKIAKPCARCIIPTVDPFTAQAQLEVRSALSYRKQGNDILFGQNLLYSNSLRLRLQVSLVELACSDAVSWKA
ncbi:MOSC N-terminal beta barrel domain-containing protein [Thiomicrospira sp. R3]|uniref:MOSC domain-containing protein n=1 Tax=Thiomicrospira sp. R3 TaxID=3035472 RepID=UPI00259B850F|nr:MOSC N-terminal beta barrel domain-containing protein [Thiomicrospira sp. R3]WFE68362.1 MOSC N-terminal beta barrel domain-containing protein [Thiomicrospira sp. R3]